MEIKHRSCHWRATQVRPLLFAMVLLPMAGCAQLGPESMKVSSLAYNESVQVGLLTSLARLQIGTEGAQNVPVLTLPVSR